MKKFYAILLAIICFTAVASAQKGQFGVGANLSYATEIENFGLGAKLQYGVTDKIRSEFSFNYFFEKNNVYGWDVNLNFHYLFNLAPRFTVYPLLGLTVSNASVDVKGAKGVTKFGLNLGGGFEYAINPKFSVGFEGKYTLVDDIDQGVFMVGGVYHF